MGSNCKIICFYGMDSFQSRKQADLAELALSFGDLNKRVLVYDIFSNLMPLPENNSTRELDKSLEADNALKVSEHMWIVTGYNEKCLNDLDLMIMISEIMSMNYAQTNNTTGKIHACIMQTAIKYKIDYVIMGLFPEWNHLTRSLFFSSHYVVTIIDGVHTIGSLNEKLASDIDHMHSLNAFNHNQNSIFKLPAFPKFIGYIQYDEINKIIATNEHSVELEAKKLDMALKCRRITRSCVNNNNFQSNLMQQSIASANCMHRIRDAILYNIQVS